MTPHTDAATTLAGIRKLEAQLRVATKNVEMHKEQYAQERDNAAMLYRALVRHAPDALAEIKSQLWQSTGEYDKLMSEASREREKRIRAEAALQRQLDDAQARERAAGYSVLVTIAPEWQGNYSHEWDEVLVVVGSEWRDGQQWYEVSGRNGKGWMPPEQLRLATGGQP